MSREIDVAEMMTAAVYRGVDDVRCEAIAVPEIGAGEVLVRIDTCGVRCRCGWCLRRFMF